MISDPTIREQGYVYFLSEAPELLQIIEQELLTLPEDHSTAKVHSLMRATHTLKGGAANVGLEVIKTVAHYLEDVVKSLYNPELIIDSELQTLLLQGYECLRLPLMVELQGGSINEEEVLERATALFAQLQDKLGDFFGAQAQIPSSIELGFDVVQSLFEMGVSQRLDSIAAALEQTDPSEVRNLLRSECEVFIGLAESLNLPGFGAIASTTIAALDANPNQIIEVSRAALNDFMQAREQVLAGDRVLGGSPSEALQKLAGKQSIQAPPPKLDPNLILDAQDLLGPDFDDDSVEMPLDIWDNPVAKTPVFESELEQFAKFLSSDRYNSKQLLKPEIGDFYLRATRYFLDWFNYYQNIPLENLSLGAIVPKSEPLNSDNKAKEIQEAKTNAEYINIWVDHFLELIKEVDESQSLFLYKKGSILSVILAIAKFQYLEQVNTPEDYRNIPLIQIIQRQLNEVAKEYKNYAPIRDEEKKWLERPQVQKLIAQQPPKEIRPEEFLLEEIWGKLNAPDSTPEQANTPEVAPLIKGLDTLNINTPSQEYEQISESLPSTIDVPAKLATQTGNELQVTDSKIKVADNSDLDKDRLNDELRVTNSKVKQPSNIKPQVIRQSVRVDLEELERLNHLAGNLLINQNRQIMQDEQLQEAIQHLRSLIGRHQQTIGQLRDWSNLMLTQPAYQRTVVVGHASCFISNAPGNKSEQPPIYNGQQPTFDFLELDQYTELYNLFNSAIEETLQIESATDIIDQIAKQFSYTLEKQQRLLSHVRDDMTAVQMSPLGDILGRFPRMIEQLSVAKAKPVELKISGSQVLVDKAIAEKLYDPLLHLVRNAFDHGIESTEIRRQQGKNPGKIEIRAYHQGNQTIIEVKDDGKGLDFESIRRRAVEMNFVAAEQASQLSKAQLLDFVFEPGFSTAKTLSDLSGRGIGLDIVRTQLQALKGSITVESQPQMGTTFSLQIPFSLTSAKFFVCHAGSATYALLSDTIAKIVVPQPEQIREFEGKKVLIYEQGYANSTTERETSVIPIYTLSDLIKYNQFSIIRPLSTFEFNQGQRTKDKIQKTNQLLLLQGSTGIFGLEVDQIIGEQELVIRPLGTAIVAPNYIFGCSILGDGQLILAIDGAVLLEQTFYPSLGGDAELPMLPASPGRESAARLLPSSNVSPTPAPAIDTNTPVREVLPPTTGFAPKTVLVVDDSISLRQTLALNLQKVGYQVLQAQDGLEALEHLRHSPNIGVVICDIEMPRMNGFEFLNQWRQDPNLSKIPVVMLTSRNSEKHRILALQLGAAGYLTKPYLEQELINQINQLGAKAAPRSATK